METIRPLRIATFTNAYLPTTNGVATSIHAFHRALETQGHEVHLFAPSVPVGADGSRVHRYASVACPGPDDYRIALPFSRGPAKALREVDFDIVHTHHPWWLGRWGLNYGRRAGVPVVTTIHTQYEKHGRCVPFHRGTVERLIRRKLVAYCSRVDLVMTPGEARKTELEALGIDTPVVVTPNGTDTRAFREASGHVPRRRMGLLEDQPIVLFVGRLAPEKRVDVLVRAMATVVKTAPAARLVMVGDGEQLGALKEQSRQLGIAPHVIFTGRVAPDEVPAYCAAADVFATASLHEVHPISAIEAMSAGTPVIAPDTGWSQGLVKHMRNGILTGEQPDQFATSMLRAITDHRLRRSLSEGATASAETHDIAAATQRLVGFYRSAIAGARTPVLTARLAAARGRHR